MPGGRDWAWASYPFLEKEVSPSNGRLEISVWSKIFNAPKKSQQEIDVFLAAYGHGFEKAGDESDRISKLMFCALNGSREAKRLFLDFPNDHPEVFDGAVAESYYERLDLYRLIDELKQKRRGRGDRTSPNAPGSFRTGRSCPR